MNRSIYFLYRRALQNLRGFQGLNFNKTTPK